MEHLHRHFGGARATPARDDAAIVALATTNRYDAVATFDRKLANKLQNFGLAAYF